MQNAIFIFRLDFLTLLFSFMALNRCKINLMHQIEPRNPPSQATIRYSTKKSLFFFQKGCHPTLALKLKSSQTLPTWTNLRTSPILRRAQIKQIYHTDDGAGSQEPPTSDAKITNAYQEPPNARPNQEPPTPPGPKCQPTQNSRKQSESPTPSARRGHPGHGEALPRPPRPPAAASSALEK